MLKGFNPWQRRITGIGIAGVLVAALGFVGPWYPVIITAFALSVMCILLLVLLGNRQNWRQLKRIQHEFDRTQRSRILPNDAGSKVTTSATVHVGAAHEYAERIRKSHSIYESFALRSKSLEIRDAFALAATQHQYDYEELSRVVAIQRLKMLPALNRTKLRHWDSRAFLALARLHVNQRATEIDLEKSIQMYAFAETMFGSRALGRNDRLLYLEALGEIHRFEEQDALADRFRTGGTFPIQRVLHRLNSLRVKEGVDSTAWLQTLNEIFLSRNFSPIRMKQISDQKPLDRLHTETNPIHDGPLVSVIIPTYQGGELLFTALRSLLEQSWKNLEIIVVDDASGPAYEQTLTKASQMSSKIRILRQDRNLGAYCARNAGLKVANGEYITVHDDDDWSHGDKIAIQVRQLVENPEIPGNMTAHVRVTDDLKFLRINNNPVLSQANFSSLMVHRSVFEAIGPWDTVNRGADSEFRDRLVKYKGQSVEVLNELPLSFTRTWEGSLTSGEMSRGFVDPARLLYLKAYTQWHEIADTKLDLLGPSEPRRFPVPTTMKPGAKNIDLGVFDVVFMTDFRFPGGTTSLTLAEMEAASNSGYRVGFVHAESPLNGPKTPVSEQLFKMQLAGTVEQVGLQDHADIRLLIVRHPSVVMYMDQSSTNLRVNRSLLIVNNPPVLVGGTGMVFDLSVCLQNMDNLFSTKTDVVAESGVTKSLCSGLVPSNRLSNTTWPGYVSLSPQRDPNFTNVPTLGRHSRDSELKWPTSYEDFAAVYKSSHYNTVFLGGADTLADKHGTGAVEDIDVYEFGALRVEDFLDSVDFWAYFHDDKLTESFGMSIAEAMAAGKVVILPKYLEASFGEGAIYSEPHEVEELVLKIWNNPSRYREQSARARNFVETHFSLNALLARIDSQMPLILQKEETP